MLHFLVHGVEDVAERAFPACGQRGGLDVVAVLALEGFQRVAVVDKIVDGVAAGVALVGGFGIFLMLQDGVDGERIGREGHFHG